MTTTPTADNTELLVKINHVKAQLDSRSAGICRNLWLSASTAKAMVPTSSSVALLVALSAAADTAWLAFQHALASDPIAADLERQLCALQSDLR